MPLEQIERLLRTVQIALAQQDPDVLVVLAEAHRHQLHREQVLRRGRRYLDPGDIG